MDDTLLLLICILFVALSVYVVDFRREMHDAIDFLTALVAAQTGAIDAKIVKHDGGFDIVRNDIEDAGREITEADDGDEA